MTVANHYVVDLQILQVLAIWLDSCNQSFLLTRTGDYITHDYFVGNTSSNKAGYWGDYACDLPLWTLENLLQHLASKSDDVSIILSL